MLLAEETIDSPNRALIQQLSILASGDDDLIGQTITNLAKTGDTRLEEFLNSTDKAAFITGQPKMEIYDSWSTWRLSWMMTLMSLLHFRTPNRKTFFNWRYSQAKPDLLDLEDISPGENYVHWSILQNS